MIDPLINLRSSEHESVPTQFRFLLLSLFCLPAFARLPTSRSSTAQHSTRTLVAYCWNGQFEYCYC
ncbi:hypothetical protein Mapa_010474 [Marchantia paleacea]|nr:hypothetical protein Mapa_010474 [Marchantia paleacea]